MSYFSDLGRRIESRWAALDRDEERFPDIAAGELERTPPGDHVDVDELVGSFLAEPQERRRQLVPVGAFGEPGLTLYYGRGFVIDVYFWNNAVPAIHNHPFCGCFTILRGFSLQDRYAFALERQLGPRTLVGKLEPDRVTLLRERTVVPFSLRAHPLIHSLVHVPNPSVSMVVRTLRTLDYFRYFPPSIALAMAEPDDLTARQLALLDWMRRAGDPAYAERARAFVAEADFETVFRAVSAACADGDAGELIDAASERHGALADRILPAIREAARLQQDNAFRERFPTGEARTVVSILMCSHDRDDVLRLLREAFPGRQPEDLLQQLDVFEHGDSSTRTAFERLVAGQERDPGWRETIFRALAT